MKNNDHNLKTACTYLSYCCVSDLTLANFSFLFERAEGGGTMEKKQDLPLWPQASLKLER